LQPVGDAGRGLAESGDEAHAEDADAAGEDQRGRWAGGRFGFGGRGGCGWLLCDLGWCGHWFLYYCY
jgi:hypothetical protein